MSFKIIIAGGRDFIDYDKLRDTCDYYLQNKEDIEIISGCARGADLLGMKYAIEKGYKLKKFPADWNLGKSAGYLRNVEMGNYGDALIAFWDGKSKGTKHMIDIALNKNLYVRIIYY